MATNPFAGFRPGQAMTPEQAQFLRNWMLEGQANLNASAGEGSNAGTFNESYYDPTSQLAFTPESGTGGWLVYDWSGARDSKDKSLLNGRKQYNYDSGGALRNQGTIRGLTKTGEYGPLMQAAAIMAAPFAVNGLQAAGLMGGANPVLAAQGAGSLGGAAGAAGGAGVTVGGPMSTGLPAGSQLGSLGEIGAGAIPEGMAFNPATAAEMGAMTGGAGGSTAAMGAGALPNVVSAPPVGTNPPAAASGFNWGSLIGPATQLVGGAMGAKAAGDAADAQLQAAREAQALSEPFRQGGMAGMNRLLDLLGLSKNTGSEGYGSLMKDFSAADFQADPGYAFRQSEGERGLTRAASASGLLGSGKYLRDATRFNQDLASQEFGNAFNRFQTNRANKLNPLQSLMGAGQTAANTLGEYATQGGNAAAAGKVGAANAWTNALGQGVSMYNNQRQADQNNQFQNALMKRWGY